MPPRPKRSCSSYLPRRRECVLIIAPLLDTREGMIEDHSTSSVTLLLYLGWLYKEGKECPLLQRISRKFIPVNGIPHIFTLHEHTQECLYSSRFGSSAVGPRISACFSSPSPRCCTVSSDSPAAEI